MGLSSSEVLAILQLLRTLLPNGPHCSEPALAKKSLPLASELLERPAECSPSVSVDSVLGCGFPRHSGGEEAQWAWRSPGKQLCPSIRALT